MRNRGPFLRWWLIFFITLFSSITVAHFGLFGKINTADATKISLAIYALFAFFTVYIGFNTKKLCDGDVDVELLNKRNELGRFVSSLMMALGLIGTVIGFIMMSETSFADLKMDNISSMRDALANIGGGISTALYTTLLGQVCCWALRIQLFNSQQYLDSLDKCECNKKTDSCMLDDEEE